MWTAHLHNVTGARQETGGDRGWEKVRQKMSLRWGWGRQSNSAHSGTVCPAASCEPRRGGEWECWVGVGGGGIPRCSANPLCECASITMTTGAMRWSRSRVPGVHSLLEKRENIVCIFFPQISARRRRLTRLMQPMFGHWEPLFTSLLLYYSRGKNWWI